jgi:flavodoxin
MNWKKGIPMVFMAAFMIAGCADASSASENGTSEEQESAGNSVVVWFSLAGEQYGVGEVTEGNTAIIADMITQKTGSDTFEIVPVDPYPTSLSALFDVALQEQRDNARPDYRGDAEDWDSYDTVYFGYPLWFDDMPMIAYHFLEDHDFSGKRICPFDTCGSEGLLDTVDAIREICDGAEVTEGLSVRGVTAQRDRNAAEQAVDEWLSKLQNQ